MKTRELVPVLESESRWFWRRPDIAKPRTHSESRRWSIRRIELIAQMHRFTIDLDGLVQIDEYRTVVASMYVCLNVAVFEPGLESRSDEDVVDASSVVRRPVMSVIEKLPSQVTLR